MQCSDWLSLGHLSIPEAENGVSASQFAWIKNGDRKLGCQYQEKRIDVE